MRAIWFTYTQAWASYIPLAVRAFLFQAAVPTQDQCLVSTGVLSHLQYDYKGR